jgi:hypothetical protein
MLVSWFVPHLEDTWERQEDGDHGGVRYVSHRHGMHLYHDGSQWVIAQDGFLLARSFADAAHPNTIHAGEWEVCATYPDGWEAHPHFAVQVRGLYDAVHSWEDLGDDFFVRVRLNKPVRFVREGQAYHSGAKSGGLRYCHLCPQFVSAKNFVAQHLHSAHVSEWERLRKTPVRVA